MAAKHLPQLLELLQKQDQPISSLAIRKKLKDAGLYKASESTEWTRALTKGITSGQIVQMPVKGQALAKYLYEIKRPSAAEQEQAVEPKATAKKTATANATESNGLDGFVPLQAQTSAREGVTIRKQPKGSIIITIFKATAVQMGLKKEQRVDVLVNEQTQEIAIIKNDYGFKLSGESALYIKIGAAKGKPINDLMKHPKKHYQTVNLTADFIKLKVA